MKRILCIIIIILALIFLYGKYIEVKELKVNEYKINNNAIAEEFKDLKIIQFSDLLVNEKTTNQDIDLLVSTINKYKAEIIIFTGDLIFKDYNISEEKKNYLVESLKKMDSSICKIAIFGDNDLANKDEYLKLMEQSNFKVLDNDATYIFYKNINPIEIIGLSNFNELDSIINKDTSLNPTYKIALIHEPDLVNNLVASDINLVLAGHSLGGLIQMPFMGSLIKKNNAATYTNGYYHINEKMDLYVSNGIGTEKYNFRLFNIPSINVFRIN